MKIGYIGIDFLISALTALVDAGCELLEIFTCQTDNRTEFNLQVQNYARAHAIPLTVGRVTQTDLDRLKEKGCELVVCAGYYHRLPVDPALPMVNIHPALLPMGRGAWPMPQTILKGLSESGVTIHKVAKNFDEGDILLQAKVPVVPEDNLETLTKKLCAPLSGMVVRLVTHFDELWRDAKPQGDGEYWPYLTEADFPITQDTEMARADRILRAFYGYECVYHGEDHTYGITRGRVFYSGEGFPVRGGVIRAEEVRTL